jgi:hypothetical protein
MKILFLLFPVFVIVILVSSNYIETHSLKEIEYKMPWYRKLFNMGFPFKFFFKYRYLIKKKKLDNIMFYVLMISIILLILWLVFMPINLIFII